MLQKVLMPLGGNENNNNMEEISSFVSSLVKKRKIAFHGLGVVDINGIVSSLSGAPPGAIGIAEEAVEKVSSNERTRIKEFVDSLKMKFDKKKVEYDCSVAEGDPREEINRRIIGCDLLVVHSDSAFSYSKEKEPKGFFKDIIAASRVPVIYLGGEGLQGETVGIATDFAMESFHTLYTFLHLGLLEGSRVIFSYVSSEEEPEKRFAPYQEYFKLHGFDNLAEMNLKGEKETAIRRFVDTENIGVLVLGKRGKSRIKDYLFGSLANALIDNPPCALFIHE